MTEQIFKALSDRTRLRMVSLVMKHELCVCEIMEVLNLSQSNASRHLTILKNARGTPREKAGTVGILQNQRNAASRTVPVSFTNIFRRSPLCRR